MAVQDDGKSVVAGSSNGDFALARYNADGTLDNSFPEDGLQTTDVAGDDYGRALAIQADGKFVVAGPPTSFLALDTGSPIRHPGVVSKRRLGEG
jgi:uncharacterized delta-60 repeat protein